MRPRLKLYIGYDAREAIAFEVCRHSVRRHAGAGVEIHALDQDELRARGLYTRPPDPGAATAFSLTRFLTPHLAAWDGWSVFMDCDMLVTRDIAGLLEGLDEEQALYCVKHDYVPARAVKMDGRAQAAYPRKNWSSFMVFNGAHPAVRALTPAVVNRASAAWLHRMRWLDDAAIGGLDPDWNFLVGEYRRPDRLPACVHFTNGGPWFAGCEDVDYAAAWRAERELCLAAAGGSATR